MILLTKNYNINLTEGVPENARNLIWMVFFASRSRGISLKQHFPWIEQKDKTYSLVCSANNNSNAIGSLTTREYENPKTGRYAMFGMVCVDEKCRGQGLGSQLIKRAVAQGIENKFKAIVLWTRTPEVYLRHGFELDKIDTFGRVTGHTNKTKKQTFLVSCEINNSRGIPPFASKLICYKSDSAELICAVADFGICLAEWTGSTEKVLDLIGATLPKIWYLNARKNDGIFNDLNLRGYDYTQLESAERMILKLDPSVSVPYISILDRI